MIKKKFKPITFEPKMYINKFIQNQSEDTTQKTTSFSHSSSILKTHSKERNSFSSPQLSPIEKCCNFNNNEKVKSINSFEIENDNQKRRKSQRKRKQCLWRNVPYFCYRWGMTEDEVLNELKTNKYLKK